MMLRRPKLAQIALLVAMTAIFAAFGHVAATRLIDVQRAKQLQELSDIALRRSEVAVNYATVTLDEIAALGPMSCDSGPMQAVRFKIYQRAAIKDIRAVNHDGSVICSAYSETLEFDKRWLSRNEMLPTTDGKVLLFRVDQFNDVALGVLKDIDAEHSAVAVVGINNYLFDVMPTALRAYSEVELLLADGQTIARYAPARHRKGAEFVSFTKESTVYPLRTTLRIDTAAFARWNSEAYFPIVALTSLLGLVCGLLLVRVLSKSASPIDDLDRGLEQREFKPYFQPIFNLQSGAVVGCEVLARWVRADGSVVSPLQFIPLAESSGRIEQLTWQIMSEALQQLQPRLQRDKHFKVSVNIVPHHLIAPGFVDALRSLVREAHVSTRQVVLEITEREELPDLLRAAEVIEELHFYGFRVAIDDVGIGHSGLSQIQRLGANTIKIDKFFIDTIDRDASANVVVDMLVRLARELNMTVVAEGIETAEQTAALLACGVQEGQGYIVSPPLPLPKFNELLDARAAPTAGAAAQPTAHVA